MKFMRKLGPLESILGMLPGMGQLKGLNVDDNRMKHVEAIILSMTPKERTKPDVINGSRRKRIARGSGRSVLEVNQLLKQFDMMRKLMKNKGMMKGMMGSMMGGGGPGAGGMPGMGGFPGMGGMGGGGKPKMSKMRRGFKF
jgi:signal recognition particle subunit SRP54